MARYSAVPLVELREGQPLQPGTVYLAPQDHHMMFEAGAIKLSRGPTEHQARPAVDVLFRSAATAYRERVIGVVLTGISHDGTAGVRAINAAGGLAVVQDPSDALLPGMPTHALQHNRADLILCLKELPTVLLALAMGEPVTPGS
jgi:two-component system, chemotaxis family, protein-glutamate methylesterase/glutaminase